MHTEITRHRTYGYFLCMFILICFVN